MARWFLFHIVLVDAHFSQQATAFPFITAPTFADTFPEGVREARRPIAVHIRWNFLTFLLEEQQYASSNAASSLAPFFAFFFSSPISECVFENLQKKYFNNAHLKSNNEFPLFSPTVPTGSLCFLLNISYIIALCSQILATRGTTIVLR